jgi:membrane associated rhomboid family serine protease
MVLPIGHETHGRKIVPIVVYSLIIINIVVFLLELFLGNKFILGYSTIPYEITHNVDLVKTIRSHGTAIPQAVGPSPIYLTLLTSMFMHGSIMHIAGNMLYLWIFGDEIEANFGKVKFLIFYLLCGLVASFSQIVVDPNSVIPSLGASGAIAGVLGAFIVMFPTYWVKVLLPLGFFIVPVKIPAIFVLGLWIATQVFSQFTSIVEHTSQTRGDGIAYMAHIGGFIAGVGLSFLFRKKQKVTYRKFVLYEED